MASVPRRQCPTARRLAALEPTVRARCQDLLDRLLVRIDADGSADLVEELAFPLPAVVVFALIGFPDDDTEQLKQWCTDRMAFSWGRPSASAQVRIAEQMTAYWSFCETFVRGRVTDPRDDFTSDLVRVHLDDPEAISVEDWALAMFGQSPGALAVPGVVVCAVAVYLACARTTTARGA